MGLPLHPSKVTVGPVGQQAQPRRGGRDIKKKSRSDTIWSGRGGAGQEILANTTPAALSKVALRFLFEAQPPLLG